MCLIIYKLANKSISKQRLQQAYRANPDGYGLMYYSDGILRSMKGVLGEFEDFYFQFEFSQVCHSVDFIIHFRTASSGQISADHCHPLFVNSDLAFMQNGNYYEYSNYFPGRKDDGKTDVQRFNQEVLQKLPKDFLSRNEIRDALELYCRVNFVKMVFMDNNGNVIIINERAGEWKNGIWYSNGGIEDYIGYGYSGAYYYRTDDIRHKGGLISVQQFSAGDRRKWGRCLSCEGWFLKEKLINGICNDCRIWKELLKYV